MSIIMHEKHLLELLNQALTINLLQRGLLHETVMSVIICRTLFFGDSPGRTVTAAPYPDCAPSAASYNA